ncbi:YlbE family protein [Thermaerobacter litoralis]
MVSVDQANHEALRRILAARPVLVAVAPAAEVVPGLGEGVILHAGPPISWERMSGPLRGAVIGGILFEGWARSEAEAVALVEGGQIRFDPCHHHQAVGPMAGVTTPSMPVWVVENTAFGNRAFCNLNEGLGKVLRYGAYGEEVLRRLAWMRDVLGPALAAALERLPGGIDLKHLIAQALHMGDEGHNRNKAGSALLLRTLAPALARVGAAGDGRLGGRLAEVFDFLAANEMFALNLVMAACKATMDPAHGIPGSSVVTAMARNGTDFGIRVSGLGDRWFTAPSQVPQGLYFPGFRAEDANPDIGDSTITETAGLGGFAMAAAPAIVQFVGGTPRDALQATLDMYAITAGENPAFGIPVLDFRGTPTGIDIRKVVETGLLPRVNTGIAHKEAGIGQIGAGLVEPPMACFEEALLALAEAVDPEEPAPSPGEPAGGASAG